MACEIQILGKTRMITVQGMTQKEALNLAAMLNMGTVVIEGGFCPQCGNKDLEVIENDELYCKKCDFIAWNPSY